MGQCITAWLLCHCIYMGQRTPLKKFRTTILTNDSQAWEPVLTTELNKIEDTSILLLFFEDDVAVLYMFTGTESRNHIDNSNVLAEVSFSPCVYEYLSQKQSVSPLNFRRAPQITIHNSQQQRERCEQHLNLQHNPNTQIIL